MSTSAPVRPIAGRASGDADALAPPHADWLRDRGGRPEEAPVYRPAIPELWRVPDALARIRILLAEHPEGGDLAGFLPPIAADASDRPLKARAAVASTLMAGLELVREGILTLRQDDAFGAVTLHLRLDREKSEATAA